MHFTEQCREYGEARLALVAKCTAEKSWTTAWEPPKNAFPIVWGDCWKGILEVPVTDYVADLGFFMDVLGFDVNAISPEFAMLMSPDKSFMFSILPSSPERPAPDPNSVRLEFMVSAIDVLAPELASRGIDVGPLIAEWGEQIPMRTLQFETPSGLKIKIWGFPASEAGE